MYRNKQFCEAAVGTGGTGYRFLNVNEDRDSTKPNPYADPLMYKPPKVKGAQMTTSFGGRYDKRLGRARMVDNHAFNPVHYPEKGIPYQQYVPYLKTQPPHTRKLGFGTKNASVRDEFLSSAIKGELWRQTILKENKLQHDMNEKMKETRRGGSRGGSRGGRRPPRRPMSASMAGTGKGGLLDPAASTNFRLATTRAQPRDSSGKKIFHFDRTCGHARFTYNPRADVIKPHTKREKRYGSMRPSSADIGRLAKDAPSAKSKFGVVNRRREMWDSGHLGWGR